MVTYIPCRLDGGNFLILCLLLTLVGCGADARIIEIGEFSPPDDFSADGAAWVRQSELTPADERLLNNYFEYEPSVVDNPMISGEPNLYRSDDMRIRFYWFFPVKTEVRWLFLEFGRRGFIKLEEGGGEPFVTSAE